MANDDRDILELLKVNLISLRRADTVARFVPLEITISFPGLPNLHQLRLPIPCPSVQ